jgi:hypothetical protein
LTFTVEKAAFVYLFSAAIFRLNTELHTSVLLWSNRQNISELRECQLCDISSLTLKKGMMKLVHIFYQTQNILFYVLRKKFFFALDGLG